MTVETPGPGPAAARLAQARHDLRTPVNAIVGYSEMLQEDADPDAQPELHAGLGRLQTLGKQVQALIGEVLGAARLENDPHLELNALAAEVQARLLPPCREARVTVAALLARAEQPALQAFQDDLRRIALAADNLLALLGELFGLRIAERGARVEQPQPQELPSSASNPQSAIRAPQAEEGEDAEAAFAEMSGHVLVVDDQPFNRDMLARELRRQKRYFTLARNGREALDLLRAGAFDLVLLDILMPELDGFETLRLLKADDRLKHTPVIMISALDELDAVVRCIEMGAEDYLPKPFNAVLLRARVGACLEKKRLRDQELEYLRNVAAVTEAAAAVESGSFDPEALTEVAGRTDALGRLARVFQSMAREVQAREQRLRQEVRELRIEIDESRKAHQVAEITETDYFQQLQQKAQGMRRRAPPKPEET
jgi:DNA-binding response OmpR family regulator